ncbi:hypothetical protein [Paracidovorax valerianellae]|uniref:Uncharacterized protein n=1 Tax=Paracidovorax valerianellae TaxID=187868 RepID=A0A1G6XWQ7_9BURK|nr:hypothetical protein [Paracidovorax valerianellae]MDA8443584.1 hypothetical protein [Paracidovorax valerianellae]SDD82609.1 hypothetical protein SAMN05192589_109138 [Paracidovorax valerianellae]
MPCISHYFAMRKTLALCAGSLVLASSSWAQTPAAPNAEPEPGLWAFEGELNGQPGRSLQIDTEQGRALIVSYLGYRADGTSLFLQASGLRSGDSSAFRGPLQEFRNGPPVIGGGAGNGEVAGSPGETQLTFDSPTSGTVTLPGDAARRISRFTYGPMVIGSSSGLYTLQTYSSRLNPTPTASYRIEMRSGNFLMSQLTTSDGRMCSYSGTYQKRGQGIESDGTASCVDPSGTQVRSPYRIEQFAVDSYGLATGTLRKDGIESFFMGACHAGAIFLGSPATCASSSSRTDVMVQPGIWAFDDELNGRPGRSLQIDTQNGSRALVLSYLGYRTDGSSLFMQGSTANRDTSNQFTVPLTEFRNGPVIGGAIRPADVASTVGAATIVFDSPTTGTITLPFDTPRRISRFRYEDHLVRFNKAFSAQVYPFWSPTGTATSIDMVVRDNVFRMDTRTENPSVACEYRGTYRLSGEGLDSEGTRTCTASTGTTSEAYRAEQFTVDRNGLLRGMMQNASDGGGRYIYLGACWNGRLCTQPELEQPR